MLNDLKFLLDFSATDGLEDLKEKLVDAVKNEKKLYPIKVSIFSEYDEVCFVMSMADKDGHDYSIGQFSCSQNDFVGIAQEQGFKMDFSDYEKLSKEEKKELEKEAGEDMKHNPFKDKIKEFA